MQVPASASNGNVVQDDGANVRVMPVCPHCGKVMQNCTLGGHVAPGCTSFIGDASCFSCGKTFGITLYRGRNY